MVSERERIDSEYLGDFLERQQVLSVDPSQDIKNFRERQKDLRVIHPVRPLESGFYLNQATRLSECHGLNIRPRAIDKSPAAIQREAGKIPFASMRSFVLTRHRSGLNRSVPILDSFMNAPLWKRQGFSPSVKDRIFGTVGVPSGSTPSADR